MSFSTPTPRRRAPPRRTAQSVFDMSGSQVSSTAPSLPATSFGAFTPRAAVQTPIGHRFQPAAAQDELMADAATAYGTVSVAGSSVFGGSVLSELPDELDGAGRARKAGAGARPREVWMNDGRVEAWKKGGLPTAVQQVLDASGQSPCRSSSGRLAVAPQALTAQSVRRTARRPLHEPALGHLLAADGLCLAANALGALHLVLPRASGVSAAGSDAAGPLREC